MRRVGRVAVAAAVLCAAAFVLPATSTAAPSGAPFPEGVPPSGVGGVATGWGADNDGQTDVPASLDHQTVIAVSAGESHALALTSQGTVVGWGDPASGDTVPPASLTGKTVTAIAAGNAFSLALTSQGAVVPWGNNINGITELPAALDGQRVTAIAAGTSHALALTSGGKVVGWGGDSYGDTVTPPELADQTVTAIAAGYAYSVALTSTGQVVEWGDPFLPPPPASLAGKTITAIAAGGDHVLALTSDGAVTTWGGGTDLDVPASLTGRTVTAVAGGTYFSVALTSDGDVTAWGDEVFGGTDVPSALNGHATAIAAGYGFGLAIASSAADYVPPVLDVPVNNPRFRTVDPEGVNAYYRPATAVDAVDGPVPVTCTPPPGSAFPVGITQVECSATDSAGNRATAILLIIVILEPSRVVVSDVAPASGSVAGGSTVTLTGHGFTGARYVAFGRAHTTDFTVVSDTELTVVAPPAARRAGFVHVTVHGRGNAAGLVANKYHYLPAIASVSPASGPAGTHVTITGVGFTGARYVTFGTAGATSYRVVSDTEVTAVVPDIDPGAVDIRVNVPGGSTAITSADRFTVT